MHRLTTGIFLIAFAASAATAATTLREAQIRVVTVTEPLPADLTSPEGKTRWHLESITVGAANQGNWLRLIEVLGAPETGPKLNEDPRFATNADRMRNLPALQAALTPLFKVRTSADWLRHLEEAGVPAGPVLDVAQMHADPQALAREMIVETTHPVAGRVASLGLPIKFSETPGAVRRAAPVLGQHTREVLRELGFSDAEADEMAAQGTVKIPGSAKANTR